MCTVSWVYQQDTYEVFFNRDELKTRLPEVGPALSVRNGVSYLAPQDTDSGGTWLFVNECGLTLGVLNQYPEHAQQPLEPRISRGALIRSLADCPHIDAVGQRLQAENLQHYSPFMIFAVGLNCGSAMWVWDTHTLSYHPDAEKQLPFSSSSYRSDEVVGVRRHLFFEQMMQKGDLTPEDLEAFHEFTFPEAGAYSVCMERDDAQTTSISRIRVDMEGALYNYRPRLPGKKEFAEASDLSLELQLDLVK